MPLATLDDVKRVMRIPATDATRDAELQEALNVAHERVEHLLDASYSGDVLTLRFHDVADDALLRLPEPATVAAVRLDGAETSEWRVLLGRQLQLTGEPGGVVNYHSEVEIDLSVGAIVPADLRDAVALLAAAQAPGAPASGTSAVISSERIGDYSVSYDTGSGGTASFEKSGLGLLRPYRRRGAVAV